MISTRAKWKVRLWASVAMLVLALGSISVPILLAAQSPDVCSMECCVAEGHCCCIPRHAYVAGQVPGDEPAINTPAELSAPCPSKCAISASFAPIHHPRSDRAPIQAFDPAITLSLLSWEQAQAHHFLISQPSSPRAPPSLHALV